MTTPNNRTQLAFFYKTAKLFLLIRKRPQTQGEGMRFVFKVLKNTADGLRTAFNRGNFSYMIAALSVILLISAFVKLPVWLLLLNTDGTNLQNGQLTLSIPWINDTEIETPQAQDAEYRFAPDEATPDTNMTTSNREQPIVLDATLIHATPKAPRCLMKYPETPWLRTDYVLYSPRDYDMYLTLQRPVFRQWQHRLFVPRTDYIFAGSHLIVMERVPNLQLLKISSER